MRNFSNYILYNFKDEPKDFYSRLRLNVDLCKELDVTIYSFPMKFHPITGEDRFNRDYLGKQWNRKYVRAIQAVLNAIKGKVGSEEDFFEKAFGRNENEFFKILNMPETMILYGLVKRTIHIRFLKMRGGNVGTKHLATSTIRKRLN
ncbi:MAG: hypothetical protein LBR17_04605 [Bacteroidales bacterium]|jgi:hypothetical protein|nr:hypothetical protein [Bacteroidales bacterium]